jgi:3-carboxy-cis,cis-muconate cycloisomerase
MAQQHERGLGNWQPNWPNGRLVPGRAWCLRALNEAFAGLVIDRPACCAISMLQGLVFAESASIALAGVIGRPRAHGLLEQLTRKAVADGAQLVDVLVDAVQADAQLGKEIDIGHVARAVRSGAGDATCTRLAEPQLEHLRAALAAG